MLDITAPPRGRRDRQREHVALHLGHVDGVIGAAEALRASRRLMKPARNVAVPLPRLPITAMSRRRLRTVTAALAWR